MKQLLILLGATLFAIWLLRRRGQSQVRLGFVDSEGNPSDVEKAIINVDPLEEELMRRQDTMSVLEPITVVRSSGLDAWEATVYGEGARQRSGEDIVTEYFTTGPGAMAQTRTQ